MSRQQPLHLEDTPATSPDREPPLLLLHGALGSMREWDLIRPLFADRRTIALDFPAHGGSQETDAQNALTTKDLARIVITELDSAGVIEVDILGYSLGGYVAIEIALIRPQLVRSIVSHAMKFYWSDEAIESALAGLDWATLSISEKRVRKLNATHHTAGGEACARCSRELIRSFMKQQLTPSDLHLLDAPLLISAGDHDELVPLSELLKLYQALGADRASLSVFPATRHPIGLIDPTLLHQVVTHFWKSNICHHAH